LAEPYLLTIQQEGKAEFGLAYYCSSSIGVDMFGNRIISADSILKRADMAMYQAKNAGRNTIRFFESNIPISPQTEEQ
jgi:GGDEF domain-containing protein